MGEFPIEVVTTPPVLRVQEYDRRFVIRVVGVDDCPKQDLSEESFRLPDRLSIAQEILAAAWLDEPLDHHDGDGRIVVVHRGSSVSADPRGLSADGGGASFRHGTGSPRRMPRAWWRENRDLIRWSPPMAIARDRDVCDPAGERGHVLRVGESSRRTKCPRRQFHGPSTAWLRQCGPGPWAFGRVPAAKGGHGSAPAALNRRGPGVEARRACLA